MEPSAIYRSGRISSYGRLLAIFLGLIAVLSPLYIDRRPEIEPEFGEPLISNISSYLLPLVLLVLILAITLLGFLEQSFTRFDAYWIYRVGGSSTGILIILLVLALVLKCKA
ncbi:hypothetical protein Vadar_001243 [Vaccinium darrowii]|uniref:Uncharacterized protein n=1 Tax=Vaccinium darrowii TaxID=229202 RepID=A0ACB7X729_9ERIC|nr:hypothetical protein Vadar_001243 [Vaccinium darrowii]